VESLLGGGTKIWDDSVGGGCARFLDFFTGSGVCSDVMAYKIAEHFASCIVDKGVVNSCNLQNKGKGQPEAKYIDN